MSGSMAPYVDLRKRRRNRRKKAAQIARDSRGLKKARRRQARSPR